MAATIALLAIVASAPASAIDAGRAAEACFSIGWTRPELGDLNDRLEPLGYERFADNALSLGGSMHSRFGRLLLGGQGHAILSRSRDAYLPIGPFRTRVRQGYGLLDVGWVAAQSSVLELAPILGIGAGGAIFDVVDRSSQTFDDIVADPRRSTSMTRAAFLLDLGGAVTRFVPLRTGAVDAQWPNARAGLVVGVRAGYVLSVAEGEWHESNVELGDGPDSGLAGAYVRFLVGVRAVRAGR